MDTAPTDNRSTIIAESNLMPPNISEMPTGSGDPFLRTPFVGNVRALPPPLPQAPTQMFGYSPCIVNGGSYGSLSGGGYTSGYNRYFGNNYGRYGGGLGNHGMYGSYGATGSENYFGAHPVNSMDPESRFIQIAEASSRPAFQSIEALVSTIGNISSMLDSTFFALTSSFRAMLSVAASFGRLRGVFSQLWNRFALLKGFIFVYKKLLYWFRISKTDPSSSLLNQAFAEAMKTPIISNGISPSVPLIGDSPWPVFIFLSFILTAPYLVMKLLGTVMESSKNEAQDPSRWVNPIETVALFDFQARNRNELTIRAGDRVLIAPREIQHVHGLLNTGWGLATTDGEACGIVPINYVKSPKQMREERQQLNSEGPRELPIKSHVVQTKNSEEITGLGDGHTERKTKETFNGSMFE